jgi:hypothetical protein
MTCLLDANCGVDGWAMTPSAMRGVLLASAFVARWCAGSKLETDGGVFRIRDDEPKPRIGAAPHRIP